MATAQERVEALAGLREIAVAKRRDLVDEGDFEGVANTQTAIDAIDRAIADERKLGDDPVPQAKTDTRPLPKRDLGGYL